jgi:hypothetical protein
MMSTLAEPRTSTPPAAELVTFNGRGHAFSPEVESDWVK